MIQIRLSEAQTEFTRHLNARGMAHRTVKSHNQTLRRCVAVWGDIYLSSVKPQHVDKLFSDSTWSASTTNLNLSNVRQFFRWAAIHKYVDRQYDPTEGWRNRKVERRERFWLPVEEFYDLLDACHSDRDRAVVALGLFTFCRGSEINAIKIRDIDFERNTVDIWREKTKQSDVLPLVDELKEEMLIWLNAYRTQLGRELDPDWYLVPAKGPLPMIYQHHLRRLAPSGESAQYNPTVQLGKPYECVKRAMRGLGYESHGAGVHVCRRSGARALFDRMRFEGYDGALMRVSSMLGHADTKTTENYLGLKLERQQRNDMLAGKRMFPDLKKSSKVVRLEVHGGYRG